jgi:F-type H+-transporting ATPase subunit h
MAYWTAKLTSFMFTRYLHPNRTTTDGNEPNLFTDTPLFNLPRRSSVRPHTRLPSSWPPPPLAHSPEQSADAHAGLVRTFSAPTAPTPPTLPSDLATELSKFDSAEPVLASSAPSKSAQAATAGQDDGAAQGADEYLSFLERDLPKAEAQH